MLGHAHANQTAGLVACSSEPPAKLGRSELHCFPWRPGRRVLLGSIGGRCTGMLANREMHVFREEGVAARMCGECLGPKTATFLASISSSMHHSCLPDMGLLRLADICPQSLVTSVTYLRLSVVKANNGLRVPQATAQIHEHSQHNNSRSEPLPCKTGRPS